jgi:hypothetical protein
LLKTDNLNEEQKPKNVGIWSVFIKFLL